MNPEVRELLEDSLFRAREIQQFVRNLSYQDYLGDNKTQLAVERSFEIIGEALKRITRIEPSILENIREHRNIISFRNILAHAYDSLESKIVWGIIVGDLPLLIEDLERIL